MVWILFTLGYFLHKMELDRVVVLESSDEENIEVELVQIEIVEAGK